MLQKQYATYKWNNAQNVEKIYLVLKGKKGLCFTAERKEEVGPPFAPLPHGLGDLMSYCYILQPDF